jgi:hypothetical protein
MSRSVHPLKKFVQSFVTTFCSEILQIYALVPLNSMFRTDYSRNVLVEYQDLCIMQLTNVMPLASMQNYYSRSTLAVGTRQS